MKAGAFLVAVTAVSCACASHERAADARSPMAVRLVGVEASTVTDSTTYSAVIAPDAQVELAFRVGGYVVDIQRSKAAAGRTRELEPGDLVSKGASLAHVRPTDYQAVVDKAHGARDEATAGIATAEAALAEAQAASTQAELDFNRISTLWQQ